MAPSSFESHQPDRIDNLFSNVNSADVSLVCKFILVCGLWGVFSWFSGHGFGGGFEHGIPLASCLLIYETCVRQNVRTAELRARLIEIDGKITILEAAFTSQTQDREKTNKMLFHLHGRLKEDGDVGSKLEQIDANVRHLRFDPEAESFYRDLEIP